jgi:RNA polymerase sigma-70 factor (ECF subfamily)
MARAVARACPAWLRSEQEDITQDAVVRVLRVAAKKRESVDALPRAYLRKVAFAAIVDAIRRQRARPRARPGADVEELCAPGTMQSAEPEPGLSGALEDCLARLADARRTAVVLRLQGHSVVEVAQLLAWSTAKARNLVYRALADLRECLAKKGLRP